MIYRRFFNVPTWRIRSPWEELQRMRQQLEQIFDEAPGQRASAGVFPLINLTEDKDCYYLRAEFADFLIINTAKHLVENIIIDSTITIK